MLDVNEDRYYAKKFREFALKTLTKKSPQRLKKLVAKFNTIAKTRYSSIKADAQLRGRELMAAGVRRCGYGQYGIRSVAGDLWGLDGVPLGILDDLEGRTMSLTIKELCTMTGHARPTVDRAIKILLKRELIEMRTKPYNNATFYKITDKGTFAIVSQ